MPAGTRWPFPVPIIRESNSPPEDGPERLPMGSGGYELLSKLGTGGMAEVFLARRRGPYAIEHPVVVKRLHEDHLSSPSMVKMFAWEAWISSRLSHPNIARFYDVVTHLGRDHLVIEHVRGVDLASIGRALNATGRQFPFQAVIDVGVAATRALHHAHGLTDDDGRRIGLVHRDVSPQNILVSVDGDIKLIDFGVAKTTSAHVPRDTAPGVVKGKMGYIAPEHLRGQALDARGDLYALGVVLFEMVTGRRLFRRGADAEMLRQALEAEVPSLSALRPDCPPALEALVRRALAQDPRDRFDNATAMERALWEAAKSLPDERDAPTLADLAREVHAAQQERELKGPPSARAADEAAPDSSRGSADAEERPRDDDTRPEGALQRARAARDTEPPPSVKAAPVEGPQRDTSSLTPSGVQEQTDEHERTDEELIVTSTPEPATPSVRALPIVVAFVAGALAAAVALLSARSLAMGEDAPALPVPADAREADPAR
ncbi:serine/threonine protein kinase [Polyangium aurulentum]|uniref:serine/threonine protein kinase n=1 Tax=Polyangium aurulentum TaxID=2567896 RepID=UPI00146E782F|nr:serine/threonine-protein kinase [Polyangium aurulentum]UQA56631.1 serine/threonine protein kinase [Polyangium aurulentum]